MLLSRILLQSLTAAVGPLRQTRRATISSDQVRTGHAIGAVDPPPLTRFGPPGSLNHLVGGGEQRFRDGEAERLGGLEVDDELEFCHR
jgi:hypothetical protein